MNIPTEKVETTLPVSTIKEILNFTAQTNMAFANGVDYLIRMGLEQCKKERNGSSNESQIGNEGELGKDKDVTSPSNLVFTRNGIECADQEAAKREFIERATRPEPAQGELVEELSGYGNHCMHTGQEQVADLIFRAISALTHQQSKPQSAEVEEVSWFDYSDEESKQLGEYIGFPCPTCQRMRLCECDDGKLRCEKCESEHDPITLLRKLSKPAQEAGDVVEQALNALKLARDTFADNDLFVPNVNEVLYEAMLACDKALRTEDGKEGE